MIKAHFAGSFLFIELGAEEEQLEFPVVFTSGIAGTASLDSDPTKQEKDMTPLFETIVETIHAPIDNTDEPLQFQVALLDYNDYILL